MTSGQRILTKDRIAISPGTVPRLVTVIRRYTLRTHPFNGPLSRTTRLSRYQKQPPEFFSARFARSGICTPTLTIMVAPLACCSWWSHVHVFCFSLEQQCRKLELLNWNF